MSRELIEAEKEIYVALLSSLGVSRTKHLDTTKLGKPGWKTICIPDGVAIGKASFREMVEVMSVCGDVEIVITNTYSPNPNLRMIAVGTDYSEFKDVIFNDEDFPIYTVSLVGKSGMWVAVLHGLSIGYLSWKEIKRKE